MNLFFADTFYWIAFTDCISMQTMRREGITDVLTNDVHFEQEGFRAVLRESRQSD